MPTDVDNKPDKLNPGDTDWARKTALDLHGMETEESANEEEAIQRARAVLEDPNSDAEAMRQAQDTLLAQGDQESLYRATRKTGERRQGGRQGFFAKLGPGMKKYGASGGLAGMIIGATGVAGFALTPAAGLVALEKAITNDSSDATRTNIAYHRAFMSRLFAKVNALDDKIMGRGDYAKKTVTMSPEFKSRFEDAGFKNIELTPEGKIKSMTTPDGKVIDSGPKYLDYSENTVEGRRSTSRVFEVRTAFFQNQKFRNILKKFGIVKSKRISPSEEKDAAKRKAAIDKAFDDNTGLKTEPDEEKRLKAVTDKTVGENGSKVKDKVVGIADKSGKAGLATLPVSIACASYNVARLTTATIKAKWIYDLISFAYPFVRAAAQLEDQGDIEPSVMENIMDRLTWSDPDKVLKEDRPDLGLKKGDENPTYGHTAFDSRGLQMAIYGDYRGLTEYAKKFTAWGWEMKVDLAANKYVSMANSLLGGKQNVKYICQGARTIQTIASLQCLAGPIAAALCAVGAVAVPAAEKVLLPLIVSQLAEPALHFLATVDLSSALRGEGAGDAIAAGIGLLMEKQTMGSGLRPVGGKDKLQKIYKFITSTNDSYYAYMVQPQIDAAKEHPFDTTNEYSFTGQLSTMLNPNHTDDGTLFGKITNLTSIVGKTFGALPGATAHALVSQPSNMTFRDALGGDPVANRLDKCESPSMKDIDAACDWSGRIVGYSPDEVIQGANDMANGGGSDIVDSSLEYLQGNHCTKTTGSDPCVSDSGEPQHEFADWIKYCTDEREDPMAMTSEPIVEDKGNWHDGERCLGKDDKDQKMLNSFAVWYNWCYIQYATAERKTDCISDKPEEDSGASSTQSGKSDCGGGTTESIYECALQFDPYGYGVSLPHDEYGKVSWYQSFKSSPPAPEALQFDCSALVMAAVVAAFGQDVPNQVAPGTFSGDPSHWQSVPKDQAKKGDVVVMSGHVEIIKENDGKGHFTTFGAHTAGVALDKQIGESGYDYGAVDVGTYRYVGPGVGTGTGNLNV